MCFNREQDHTAKPVILLRFRTAMGHGRMPVVTYSLQLRLKSFFYRFLLGGNAFIPRMLHGSSNSRVLVIVLVASWYCGRVDLELERMKNCGRPGGVSFKIRTMVDF